jgi:hypothetical protein
MAFQTTVQWDVRTTGSDSNGGGFDPVSGVPGTDFSQQDAAQIAFTDLVIDAATNTKCTSAAHPFGATHVGNFINITAGTGFTVQRVQILSVSGVIATVDKSLGTLGSTGGTGNLGGGLLTLATAVSNAVTENVVNIKTGTYTLTVAITGLPASATFRGYNASHGDDGARPTITTATNSVNLIELANSRLAVDNIIFTNTAGTPGDGIHAKTVNNSALQVRKCKFTGFAWALNGNFGVDWSFSPLFLKECEFTACTSGGVQNSFGGTITDCYFHDITNDGIKSLSEATTGPTAAWYCNRTIFARCGNGFEQTQGGTAQPCQFERCVFAFGSGDGIKFASSGLLTHNLNAIENCVFYGNTGKGINQPVAGPALFFNRTNAYGSNTGGDHPNVPAGTGDVTLSANPFTDGTGVAGHDDWSLNGNPAGLALRGAGFPGVLGVGTPSTGFQDINPIQHQDAGGGTTVVQTSVNRTTFVSEGEYV